MDKEIKNISYYIFAEPVSRSSFQLAADDLDFM